MTFNVRKTSKLSGTYGKIGRPPKNYTPPVKPIYKITIKKVIITFD